MFDKVRVLFKDQPDLLKDFSQFLPEAHSVAVHLQQEQQQVCKLSAELIVMYMSSKKLQAEAHGVEKAATITRLADHPPLPENPAPF